MKIVKSAAAGTLESSDCMIVIDPSDKGEIDIQLDSVVKTTFGNQIVESLKDELKLAGVDSCSVRIQDKGAVDCVLRARMKAAIYRAADTKYDWERENG